MLMVILGGCFTLFIAYVVYALLSTDGAETDTSIEAFFIDSPQGEKKEANANEDSYQRKYDKEGRQVLIAYGTEYGFSEEIAKKLFDRLEAEKTDKNEEFPLQLRLVNVKHYDSIDFYLEQLVLLVISTAGDGIPPTEARPFCTWLSDKCVTSKNKQKFEYLSYSVLALGDSNYPHFCRTGKTVDKNFRDVGAHCLIPCHHVDMEDWDIINSWIDELTKVIDRVKINPALDYLDIIVSEDTSTVPSRKRPFMAKLLIKRPLTKYDTVKDKETIHCEFDLTDSGIIWTSGDALGIYPQNNPSEVKMLLEVMGCAGTEMVDSPKSAFEPTTEGQIDLYSALMKYYDLKTVRSELLQLLQIKSQGSSCQTELDNLLKDGISKKNQFLQEYLYEREVADVLADFKSVVCSLSPLEILAQMKALQPRYYSVASSPVQSESQCSITVAVVRYMTLGRQRTGVATTYLQDRLEEGQCCPVFISHNPEFRLPSDGAVPIIMVGPGTGIAPFMAFISERVQLECTGRNLLYFGCRNKHGDFLYKDILESWVADKNMELKTAFSRDQQKKVYVQHLIQEDADSIWDLVHNHQGHIYVCGDARLMARDVHTELVSIIEIKGCFTYQQAEDYLSNMENKGRYQKDVWVTG